MLMLCLQRDTGREWVNGDLLPEAIVHDEAMALRCLGRWLS